MPPFLALFMSTDGVPIQVGLFTVDEFLARNAAAKDRTKWSLLINTASGMIVNRYHQPEDELLTKKPLDSGGVQA